MARSSTSRQHRRPLRRLAAASTALFALALALPGCGLGDKAAHADRIHASRRKVAEASPATGTLRLELSVDRGVLDELEGDQRAQFEAAVAGGAIPGMGGPPVLTYTTGLHAGDRRALLSAEAATEPAAVFVDTRVFVRRTNARATERRTWATLDLLQLPDEERPIEAAEMTPAQILGAVGTTVNPVYLLELTAGALAGSVEVVGEEDVAGVVTTRYDANLSFDKALTDLDFDDEHRMARELLFRMLGARKDVVPASFWIDAEGRLRRMRVELEQRVTRQRSNDLVVTLELTQFGAPAALEPPAADLTVTYDRFGRLVRSVLPEEA